MKSHSQLERLLATLEVDFERLTLSEIVSTSRLPAAPLQSVMLVYVLHGSAGLDIGDRERRNCSAGTMILVPPGIATDLTNLQTAGTVRVAVAVAKTRLCGSIGLLDRLSVPVVEDFAGSALIDAAWQHMLSSADPTASGLGSSATASLLVKLCIISILRNFVERPGIDQKIVSALTDPKLARVMATILDTPGSPHSVASLADLAGLTAPTFARLFVEALGMSPMEFVGKTRLHKAANLLRSSSAPVKIIASEVGYSSRSHFSQAFRAIYGLDPSAYRDEHQPKLPAPEPRRLTEAELTRPGWP